MKSKLFFIIPIVIIIQSSTATTHFQHSLQHGSSLSVEHGSRVLTSPDNTFTCGFYAFGTNAYWFAIWFTASADRTVVWTANREAPVNGRGSRLTLRQTGAMVLTDVDGAVVWETSTTGPDVDRAQLLNTGNLVLKSRRNKTLWQSFDYPTDTLLPSQTLTKSKSLVSALRNTSFSSGYFSLSYNSNNVLILMYNGPEISSVYYPSPDPGFNVWANGRTTYNSSRTAVFNDLGVFLSSDRWRFRASDSGSGIKRRLTMDHDGNLRVYSLNRSTGLWSISWQALAQPCDVHGVCGRNGVCVYGQEPSCACPPGHRFSDPGDLGRGCKPSFDRKCRNSTAFGFLELKYTDYYGFDLKYMQNVSLESCRDFCLVDCTCEAFSYRSTGEGLCYPKTALFNGFQSPNFTGSIYLKVPKSMLTSASSISAGYNLKCDNHTVMLGSPSMYESSDEQVKWVYLYSFASSIGVVEALVILLGWWIFYSKHGFVAKIEEGYCVISSQFRGFSYGELKRATHNFKVELGRGGSGAVYKGVLDDERVVAVKRLGEGNHGGEFWAEVSTIGMINHMNLVRMWGFCLQKRHRLLVYEYVENLSLDKRLFASSFLEWKKRFKVALGTAKGLAYLHHECLEWVIHCDVKPENILLDGGFEPKIADFGLAKLGGLNSEFTRVRGTKGYTAPEWGLNMPITAKVDVYSFGVVVLELVKGVRLSNWIVEDGEREDSGLRRLVSLVKPEIGCEEEGWIEEVVDGRLGGVFSRKQAVKMVEIGVMCVEEDRNKRPTMDTVVQILLDCEVD